MTVLGLIPARAGSKGIPDKNLVAVAGKPLIVHTFEAALASHRLERLIVSTDSDDIAAVAERHAVEVPFRRPVELATDDAPMEGVVEHALRWAETAGSRPDAIVLLQPTSPLRQATHIDEAIDLFRKSGADTVVSVVEVPHQYSPASLMTLHDGELTPYVDGRMVTRRQDKGRLYARNGPAVLVVAADLAREATLYGERTVGLEMSRHDSIDIDDDYDLLLAELLLSHRAAGQGS